MLLLADKTTIDELVDLGFNSSLHLRFKPTFKLFNWFGVRFNIKMMQGYTWIHVEHVFVRPNKDINVVPDEGHEVLLFRY